MQNLIIIGAGGFGREMCASAKDCVGYGKDFVIKGFLDSNPDALSKFAGYAPIIGDCQTYEIKEDDVFISAIGNLKSRRRCVEIILSRGGKFRSLVHKTAWIGSNVLIGEGTYISNNVVLTADISIGSHTVVFQQAVLGHDVKVGDFSHIYAQAFLGGCVEVGNQVSIFPGAKIVPRRTIGEGSVVGIGSVVILNVEPYTTVFGNPAAIVGEK